MPLFITNRNHRSGEFFYKEMACMEGVSGVRDDGAVGFPWESLRTFRCLEYHDECY